MPWRRKGSEVMPKTKKLTDKQKRFCEEYLIDLNATQAAIRAGYSAKTAYSMGQRMLKKVEVQEYIFNLQKKRSERTEITADKVIEELAAIAFSDRTKIASVNANGTVDIAATDTLPDEIRKTISCIKEGKFGVEVSSYDKIKALELLGRHLGMFTERKEDEASKEQEISFNIVPASQKSDSQDEE